MTTIESRAASAGAFAATLAGRFALTNHHAPPASTTMSAAMPAASGSPNRHFSGVGAAGGRGVASSAAFAGFGFAGIPTCSE